jgi:HTH-type transcriptional regulator/antitoxin HigA
MEPLPYTVIRTQNQYLDYCEKVIDLTVIKKKTRIQLETIDLLSLLIGQWDKEQHPHSDTDPVSFLISRSPRRRQQGTVKFLSDC